MNELSSVTMSPPDETTHSRVNSLCVTDTECPLFSFGVLSDVHYVDKDNGFNYTKTRVRYYRNSLSLLSDAVQHWNNRHDVSFAVQLGDLIDGGNKGKGTSDVSLQKTLDICANFNGPFYHIWGNHELYNFTKDQLAESPLNSSIEHSLANNGDKSEEPSNSENISNYYHFSPIWRGAHILCEYRLAPGAILHAGTERAGLRVRYSRRC